MALRLLGYNTVGKFIPRCWKGTAEIQEKQCGFNATSGVMWAFYQIVAVRRGLSLEDKAFSLPVDQQKPSPMIMSFREWMKKIQADEISLLPRVTGLNLKDKELWHLERVDLLLFLVERSQLRCFKRLIFLSSEHVQLEGEGEGVDLELLWGIMYLTWPGNALGTPRRKMNIWNSLLSLLPPWHDPR